jgi:hypothetical protein
MLRQPCRHKCQSATHGCCHSAEGTCVDLSYYVHGSIGVITVVCLPNLIYVNTAHPLLLHSIACIYSFAASRRSPELLKQEKRMVSWTSYSPQIFGERHHDAGKFLEKWSKFGDQNILHFREAGWERPVKASNRIKYDKSQRKLSCPWDRYATMIDDNN